MKTDFNIRIPRDIEFDGIPDDVKVELGNAAVYAHNQRIRELSLTADGQAIDRNAESWEEAKLLNRTEEPAKHWHPLVYTGYSTEQESWEVDLVGDDLIQCKLDEEGASHVRDALDNAKGRNWEYVYGVGEVEKSAVMKVLIDGPHSLKTWLYKVLRVMPVDRGR